MRRANLALLTVNQKHLKKLTRVNCNISETLDIFTIVTRNSFHQRL